MQSISDKSLWAGRILGALVVLFMTFDGVIHLLKPAPVVQAFAQLGWPLSVSIGLGVLLLCCVVLYVIPRTAVLGAILLTGYLGGAVATHVRVGNPAFECLFPVIFGLFVWGGIWFRYDSLRALIPVLR